MAWTFPSPTGRGIKGEGLRGLTYKLFWEPFRATKVFNANVQLTHDATKTFRWAAATWDSNFFGSVCNLGRDSQFPMESELKEPPEVTE